MASVAVACPTTTAYRAVRPHLSAASSTLSHAFCPPGQKARVFAPVLGSWCGLRRLRLSPAGIRSAAVEKKGTCRRMVVYASLFGVGAPEVLVIGVVALLVFGPKGLAEVARTLGKTLKAFQPTIRELQEVSRDFKTTLEREIGLDEDTTSIKTENRSSTGNPQEDVNLNGSPSFEEILRASREQLQASAATTTSAEVEAPVTKAYTSEELLKVTEEQPAASATAQQSEHIASEEESQDSQLNLSNLQQLLRRLLLEHQHPKGQKARVKMRPDCFVENIS